MKGRLYANWLVVITSLLFISSLGVFLIYIQENIIDSQCALGDDLGSNCVCDSHGEKICDSPASQTTDIAEFTSKGLIYTFDFLNLMDSALGSNGVVFTNISKSSNNLKVVIEIDSMCNEENIVAPQIGFYKQDEKKLVLSVVSNLTDPSFNLSCRSENIFIIENFDMNVNDSFKIEFQDEYDSVYQAEICIYEGYIRNEGDVYESTDDTQICKCQNGSTECRLE